MNHPIFHLKAHRDEALLRGHPWIFSRALRDPQTALPPGTIVDIHDAADHFVARGYYNPQTDIAVRILTRDPAEDVDATLIADRVRRALRLRQPFLHETHTNAYRLINAEGDFLPGAIVDRYDDVLVAQISTAGMELLTGDLVAALREVINPASIVLRNDVASRAREGMERERTRLAWGAETPPLIEIRENDLIYTVDVWTGQKTGFFLDQRDKRRALAKYVAGRTVLNTFSYTGAFGVVAAVAGATHVTSVDQSGPVVAHARTQFTLNGQDPDAHEFLVGDAFAQLEKWVAAGQRFDVVILDPPAFAKTLSAKPQALRAYRRLNALGLRCLNPGGLLVTCSCSGAVTMDEFVGVLNEAAQREGRVMQTAEMFTHGLDHPNLLAMPESGYLKVLFCRA
ncbi:MAG: class I SAM-dependent rRNA methyltransferase [Ktedonobacterales bacterium]|nr:class I SAM-dependent rRNA methyltransferase [Ktedonobacterales bacterium]